MVHVLKTCTDQFGGNKTCRIRRILPDAIKGLYEGAQYDGKAQPLTPKWWEMVRFSMEEADRLGLKLGMHICDGFALAGGPWITPEESMQKVVWSDTI